MGLFYLRLPYCSKLNWFLALASAKPILLHNWDETSGVDLLFAPWAIALHRWKSLCPGGLSMGMM